MDFTSRMAALLGAFRRERNGAVADSMRLYGKPYGLNYGVSLPTLRTLARAEGTDHEFARYLYQQDVRCLRLAAFHIADPARLLPAEFAFWGGGLLNSELAEEAAFALLSRSEALPALFEAWTAPGAPCLEQYAALMAAARAPHPSPAWIAPTVEAVRRAGMGMDCVSGNEVRMAVENGFAASEIVFAGVGKTDREIEYALGQEIFSFNCESLHELQVINEIAGRMGKKARIALRINPDVDPKTHRYITTGKADNKFGISYDEIDAAIASLEKLANLEIVGLHFHIGSQIRDMQVFETFSKRVFDIKEWFREKGIVLKHLNMGGGLGIDYDDPDREPMPDFETYFDIFHRNLKIDEGQTVHFELGRSLVAQCGELITRALYNKETSAGTKIVIVDAGMTDLIRPALYGAKHKIENLTSATGSEKYTIGGPICESSDIFGRDVELPVTSRGDLLTLRSAGAYGMAMASRYNLQDLPGAVYSDKL